MPKDKVESDSTNRSNPYITKSISKTLLTPCRQVGLSRKRKTPNSSTSVSKNNETSNLEVTPVTSKVASFEDTTESKTAKKTSEIAKRPNKSVSKCLIVDGSDETSSGNLKVTPVTSKVASFEDKSESKTKKTSEIAKKPKKSVSKCLMLDRNDEPLPSICPAEETGKSSSNIKSKKSGDMYRKIKKTEDDDFSSDNSTSELPLKVFKEKLKSDKNKKGNKRFIAEDEKSPSSSQTSDENLNISIKKAKHEKIKAVKNKRRLLIDDDEDDFICKSNTSKMKKTENKNVKTKKRLIIEDEDDEDFCSISGVEKIENNNQSPEFKGFHEKKKDRVLSDVGKDEEKKKERVLSVEEKGTDTKKASVLAEIQTENNTKKEGKTSRLTLRRSLSMKKSSDDIQEKTAILKDCTVNLIDTCKLKSENSSQISEEEVNKLESKVEAKRKIVEDLKQAEIYKRLHNVENLKKLTATWKNGCILALNDLLPHLQAQSPTPVGGMKTLLKDLGVKDNIIALLAENGDLS